jgi:hypothetical protein
MYWHVPATHINSFDGMQSEFWEHEASYVFSTQVLLTLQKSPEAQQVPLAGTHPPVPVFEPRL